MVNIEDLLQRVQYRRTKHTRKPREPTTLDTYRSIYTRFDEFCKGKWTTDAVMKFMQQYPDNNQQRKLYYALKSAFTVQQLPWFTSDFDPLPPPSATVERPFYSREDIEKLLAAARHNLKHYLVIRIMFLAGPRKIQLCRIRAIDYDSNRGMLNIPGAKQTPEGEWLCDPTTKQLLDTYMGFHKRRFPYLFPGRRDTNGMMDEDTVRKIFKHYCEVAGVTYKEQGFKHGKGAHGARRGRVTNLYDLGFREDEITKLLRWTNPFTVHTYIQKLAPRIAQEVAQRDPMYQEKA